MWGLIGEDGTVASAGQNRRAPVFGALDGLKTAIREAIHSLNRSRELKMTVSFDILHPLRKAAYQQDKAAYQQD